jgi:hypothetical protein
VNCILATTGTVVDISFCDYAHAVATQQTCNVQLCEVFSWEYGPWSDCSIVCGGGIMSRPVTCKSDLKGTAPSALCSASTLSNTSLPCNAVACPTGSFNWLSGPWSECSKPCNGGTETREVVCVDNNQLSVVTTSCSAPKTATTAACNSQACPVYRWEVCEFGECTAACGGGTDGGSAGGSMLGSQTRKIMCINDYDKSLADSSLCVFLPTPNTTLVGCNAQACTDWNWMTTPWTQCVANAVGAKSGNRTRTTHCHARDGSNANMADCDKYIPLLKPKLVESCFVDKCPVATATPVKELSSAHLTPAVSFGLLSLGLLTLF